MVDGSVEPEIALGGGRLTPGVVKVGGTVRRPVSPASRLTAMLLAHLAKEGFDGAPRYLGQDGLGREILTFVPGQVPAKWRAFVDEQIARAGMLLRRMHDASRSLADRLEGGEVVCHHDPGPNNTVFRDDLPVAFIDFDFAAVGDPLADVGYMAWSWCISSKPARGLPIEQARQVRVLADAYRLSADQRRRLVTAIEDRFVRNECYWRERADADQPGHAGPTAAEVLTWTRREAAHFASCRSVFAEALDSCATGPASTEPNSSVEATQ